jgi:hypothetical protein
MILYDDSNGLMTKQQLRMTHEQMKSKGNKVKRGDVYLMPRGSSVWYVLSQKELDALYEDDRRRGDTLDSAGEPRIHNRQGRIYFAEPTTVMVIGLTGAQWGSWYNKPVGLVRAIITSGANLGTEISVTKQMLLTTVGSSAKPTLKEV